MLRRRTSRPRSERIGIGWNERLKRRGGETIRTASEQAEVELKVEDMVNNRIRLGTEDKLITRGLTIGDSVDPVDPMDQEVRVARLPMDLEEAVIIRRP